MKIITRKIDNVIILGCSIGVVNEIHQAIEIEPGSFMGPIEDFNIFEVPNDFKYVPHKQCYDGKVIFENKKYVEPPLSNEEQLKQLQKRQELLEKAVDELIFGGMF